MTNPGPRVSWAAKKMKPGSQMRRWYLWCSWFSPHWKRYFCESWIGIPGSALQTCNCRQCQWINCRKRRSITVWEIPGWHGEVKRAKDLDKGSAPFITENLINDRIAFTSIQINPEEERVARGIREAPQVSVTFEKALISLTWPRSEYVLVCWYERNKTHWNIYLCPLFPISDDCWSHYAEPRCHEINSRNCY